MTDQSDEAERRATAFLVAATKKVGDEARRLHPEANVALFLFLPDQAGTMSIVHVATAPLDETAKAIRRHLDRLEGGPP